MTTYVSILRGINVSGQKMIKMDALKQLYAKLNFEHIQTYIQSGNVIFSAQSSDRRGLEQLISSQIEKEFGFNVPVIVLTVESLAIIVQNNPFIKDHQKDIAHFYVTFLASQLSDFQHQNIDKFLRNDEEILITSAAVYLYCPNGYGKTKLHNTFLEKTLHVQATTRNWKTVNALLELAQN